MPLSRAHTSAKAADVAILLLYKNTWVTYNYYAKYGSATTLTP